MKKISLKTSLIMLLIALITIPFILTLVVNDNRVGEIIQKVGEEGYPVLMSEEGNVLEYAHEGADQLAFSKTLEENNTKLLLALPKSIWTQGARRLVLVTSAVSVTLLALAMILAFFVNDHREKILKDNKTGSDDLGQWHRDITARELEDLHQSVEEMGDNVSSLIGDILQVTEQVSQSSNQGSEMTSKTHLSLVKVKQMIEVLQEESCHAVTIMGKHLDQLHDQTSFAIILDSIMDVNDMTEHIQLALNQIGSEKVEPVIALEEEVLASGITQLTKLLNSINQALQVQVDQLELG